MQQPSQDLAIRTACGKPMTLKSSSRINRPVIMRLDSTMQNAMRIRSLEEFVTAIRADATKWGDTRYPWFRGEPDSARPLLPRLYRRRKGKPPYQAFENQLLQTFRLKAASFSDHPLPARESTDQWLFLAQHVGLPTRLLDWTESALVALWFALLATKPVVWMLNPRELNKLSVSDKDGKKSIGSDEFPLTWFSPPCRINIGSESINAAWEQRASRVDLPVAIVPTYVHGRMSAQRSCFTIHGRKEQPLNQLVSPDVAKRYKIEPSAATGLQRDLRMLGIMRATAFPDLDGLTGELASLY